MLYYIKCDIAILNIAACADTEPTVEDSDSTRADTARADTAQADTAQADTAQADAAQADTGKSSEDNQQKPSLGTRPERQNVEAENLAAAKKAIAAREVRKRAFWAIYIYKSSFYQDRLGTNIGKTQKILPFSQVELNNLTTAQGVLESLRRAGVGAALVAEVTDKASKMCPRWRILPPKTL
jgi:hypothetical protein